MNTKFNVELTRFEVHMLMDAIHHERAWIENNLAKETDDLAIACMGERYRKLDELRLTIRKQIPTEKK